MAKIAKPVEGDKSKATTALAKPVIAVSLAPTVKPPYRPKSFSMRQLREAIAATRR